MAVLHCCVESQTSIIYYDVHWTQSIICVRHKIKHLENVHKKEKLKLF